VHRRGKVGVVEVPGVKRIRRLEFVLFRFLRV